MLAFRFANGMFEPMWNRNYIDHVQITAAEDIGIGSRAGYYDTAGALRDLIQNHMLQLLCHVAMEPPVDFTADEVRNEKVKVLHAIHAPTPEEQIDRDRRPRAVRRGRRPAASSRRLPRGGAASRPDSNTETYAALRLEVDNWRWAGVPFYLRTGKRLARKVTEIAVTLKPVPHLAFKQEGSVGVRPNQLVLTMQPNEGVSLSLGAKIPGHADADPPGEHGVPLRDVVPVAVAGGLRAADPRRDARRRDALHPQRRGRGAVADLRPDRAGVGGDARAAAEVPGRLAGAGGGRDADARAGASSGGRSEDARRLRQPSGPREGTTPAEIEAALREMLKERHAENESFVAGARAEHGRASSTRRGAARSPTACAGRALPRVAHDRARGRAQAHADRRACATIASECIPRPGEFAAAARDRDRRRRREAPAARWTRSSTRSSSPTCRPCCGRRTATPRPSTPCCRLAQVVLLDSIDDPDIDDGAGARARAARDGLRRRPRLAALDAVARARRRDLRPGASAPRPAPHQRGHGAPPPRVGGRRRCCSSAGSASRLGWKPSKLIAAQRRR